MIGCSRSSGYDELRVKIDTVVELVREEVITILVLSRITIVDREIIPTGLSRFIGYRHVTRIIYPKQVYTKEIIF